MPAAKLPSTSAAVRFLAAAGISFYGDWLTTVALVVLLFRETGSATGPAIYMLARVAPRVLGPTPGGALSDRFGPSRVALACLVVQGAFTAALIPLGRDEIVWAIYPVVAIAQFTNSLSQPAYGAMLPRVTTAQHLGRLNGIFSAVFASSILVSPAVGALILPHTTPEILIAADSLTFFLAAMIMLTLRVGPSEDGDRISPRRALAGVHAVLEDAALRSATAALFGSAVVVTCLQAVLVVAASQHFGHDTNVGWLYAAVGAGSLIGSVVFVRPNPRRIKRRNIVAFAIAEIIAFGAFVFALNLYLAALLLFVSSIVAVCYQILGNIALQQRVPADLLGRATGASRLAMYSGMLFGAVAAVALVGPIGWERTVLVVCAAALLVLAVSTITGPRDRDRVTPLTNIPD